MVPPEMPQYYFRIPRGRYFNGAGEATELPDRFAARLEALKIWRDLMPGIAADQKSDPTWRMEVADPSGKVLMKIRTVVDIAPA